MASLTIRPGSNQKVPVPRSDDGIDRILLDGCISRISRSGRYDAQSSMISGVVTRLFVGEYEWTWQGHKPPGVVSEVSRLLFDGIGDHLKAYSASPSALIADDEYQSKVDYKVFSSMKNGMAYAAALIAFPDELVLNKSVEHVVGRITPELSSATFGTALLVTSRFLGMDNECYSRLASGLDSAATSKALTHNVSAKASVGSYDFVSPKEHSDAVDYTELAMRLAHYIDISLRLHWGIVSDGTAPSLKGNKFIDTCSSAARVYWSLYLSRAVSKGFAGEEAEKVALVCTAYEFWRKFKQFGF